MWTVDVICVECGCNLCVSMDVILYVACALWIMSSAHPLCISDK